VNWKIIVSKTAIIYSQTVKQNFKDQIKIIKIDIDKAPTIAQKYVVRGVPTLILFKNETAIWKQSGVLQAHELNTIINSYK